MPACDHTIGTVTAGAVNLRRAASPLRLLLSVARS
jgi:hypothetical protein